MKRLILMIILLLSVIGLRAQSLMNSYIYIYATSQFEQESPHYYNGSASDAADGDFNKADLGTINVLSIGGKITSTMGYDQCTLMCNIDGSKTVHEVVIPLYTGNHIGTNVIFESETGTSIDISKLEPGVHQMNVNFYVSASDSKIMSLLDPAEGSYSAPFTIAESPAPICLGSFTADALNGTVELAWVTETETENDHFLVYRDGAVIGRVAGAGTTTEQHSYTYLDTRVQDGVHSYAISDVSYGGVEKLHDALSVEVESGALSLEDFVLHKAYPNPFNPNVTINYQLSTINKVSAFVYDTKGNPVEELLNTEMSAGTHTLTWDATGMPSGVYIVKMQAGNNVQSQKIVLMK